MNLLNTASILALLLGVVIPHITALVSGTKVIPAQYGGYITLVLAAVTGFLTEWQLNPHAYDWKTGVLNSAASLVIAYLTHQNALKGTTLQGKLLAVGAPQTTPAVTGGGGGGSSTQVAPA